MHLPRAAHQTISQHAALLAVLLCLVALSKLHFLSWVCVVRVFPFVGVAVSISMQHGHGPAENMVGEIYCWNVPIEPRAQDTQCTVAINHLS